MTYFIKIIVRISVVSFLFLNSYSVLAQFSLSGFKNLPANPPELDQQSVPWLPFEENWNSGHFETNLWEVENNSNSNWRIAGQVGNEAPSVEFSYNPIVTNYQIALTSRLLSARNIIDGGIYLSFDLKNSLVNHTGQEFLRIQVITDSTWLTVSSDSDLVSINEWSERKLNLTEYVKGKIFKFRFLAEGQNSLDIYKWMIDNISVYRECAIPLNFQVTFNLPNIDEALLEWDPPTGPTGNSDWLGWDNGSNNDAIGLTDGGTFSAAIRFTSAQLDEYDEGSLTKIRLFPYNSGGTIVLKVWTGGNAAQLELEQVVETYIPGIWNEFILDNPVALPLDDEIWIGYTVTHTAGNNIAGIDSGPAVAGFGDMINLDGSTWESMTTDYELDFNWNIEGYVEYPGKNCNNVNLKPVNSHNAKHESNRIRTDFKKVKNPDRSMLYYQIYKNYELFDTTSATIYVTGYTYYDEDCYFVRAVYADCLSGESNEDCIMIVDKKINKPYESYPVPADQTLTFNIKAPLNSLIITDLYNQPVFQTGKLEEGSFTINTSSYRNGIFLIRSTEMNGNVTTDKFIINH